MKNYRVIYTLIVQAENPQHALKKASVAWEEDVDSVETEVEEVDE